MTTPGIVSPPSLASATVPSHPTAASDMTSPTQPTATPLKPSHVPDSSSTTTSISRIPPPPIHSQPKLTPEMNKPIAIHPHPISSPPNIIDAEVPPLQPVTSSPRPAPVVPSKPTSPFSPSSSSTGSPSPNRVQKTPKNREPPQRPKSKPVCELPGEESSGSVGFMNASIIDNQGESPIAPKRKKNKPNKSKANNFDSGFGINNSAFFENEANEQEDVNKEVTEPASSTKAKSVPTVIRTKPNGKDNTSVDQEPLQQTDKTQNVTQTKTTKPTVIKPSVIKPPPTTKKPPKHQENIEIPPQITSPVQPVVPPPEPIAKPKSKPTLIIPKTKKDAGNKNESKEKRAEETKVVSPPERPILESQKEDAQDKKPNKTKRIPSIIRPNRLKKDSGSPQGENVEGFRGTPEGECSQTQLKKGPVRRAPPPPRPGPPKPAPPRPGPPKKAAPEEPKASIEATSFSVKFEARPKAPAPTETKPEHVKQSHAPEVKHRLKHPRPATIGKDKEAEEHRNIEKMKRKKKPAEPVVLSVVSTKIEPSAIALYDYVAKSIDDLSFKVGSAIYIVIRAS